MNGIKYSEYSLYYTDTRGEARPTTGIRLSRLGLPEPLAAALVEAMG